MNYEAYNESRCKILNGGGAELRELRAWHKERIEKLKHELKVDTSTSTAWKVIPLSLIAESELQIKLIDAL